MNKLNHNIPRNGNKEPKLQAKIPLNVTLKKQVFVDTFIKHSQQRLYN